MVEDENKPIFSPLPEAKISAINASETGIKMAVANP